MAKKKKPERDEQQRIAFQFYEHLVDMIRDLEALDRMIPKETSRHPIGIRDGAADEGTWLIIGRKDDLLRYIQTICRDHVFFAKRITAGGWTPEMRRQKRKVSHG